MAISIISVFSTRPRPFLMYCDGINLERSARHAKIDKNVDYASSSLFINESLFCEL